MPVGSLIFPGWTIQHDLDVRNFGFARGQIPYTSMRRILLDEQVQKRLTASAGLLVPEKDMQYSSRKADSPDEQLFFRGGLLSGDEFLTAARKQELLKEFSEIDVSCADMEGFSVSAAAHLHGLPCGMVRAVSDDHSGRRPKNFRAFLQRQSFRFRQMIETFCASASD
jgi:adenosylhomocysteine nucleosidase